jgi:methanogenic corrinoid protein MtbC1
MHPIKDRLVTQIAELDERGVLETVRESMQSGYDPFRIIEACQEGVRLVGVQYEKGRYFIAGLIMAGLILKSVIGLIRPQLHGRVHGRSKGNIVIGTVQGDIHDIGKNLGAMLLSCEGFHMIDMGVDVPPETFVKAVLEYRPRIVGLSCLLTTAFDGLKQTIDAVKKAGLRTGLPIIIGGSMLEESVCEYAGADYWTRDAIMGVQWCRWVIERK